jgi:general secretion pathway protein M
MKAQLLDWWRQRSVREQRLLLVMVALLAVTILWLGIYRPIQDARSGARERHQQAVVRLAEMRAEAAALRPGPAALSGPLASVVTQSATDAGFANAAVTPRGDGRVAVSIPSARPAPFFAWIASLEARGIVVEQLSARANADPTLAVAATLTGGSECASGSRCAGRCSSWLCSCWRCSPSCRCVWCWRGAALPRAKPAAASGRAR